MFLYRAIYQRLPQHGGTLRGFTFVASSTQAAQAVANDWQMPTDRLLTLKAVRPLQTVRPQLTLEG